MDSRIFIKAKDYIVVNSKISNDNSALLRIVDMLRKYTTQIHGSTHENIVNYILNNKSEFSITMDDNDYKKSRNTVSRNISELSKEGKSRQNFIPVFLSWLWEYSENSRSDLIVFFNEIGFDIDYTIKSLEKTTSPFARARTIPDGQAILNSRAQAHPYDFKTLISFAQSSITFIEQNQWYLVGENGDGTDYWPFIEDALKRGVCIEIVAMKKGVYPPSASIMSKPDSIALWSLYQGTDKFEEHLNYCWNKLSEWQDKSKFLKINNLIPDTADLVICEVFFSPITMTVVDRKLNNSIMVLSPRINDKTPDVRPEFVIKKSGNVESFNQFIRYVDNFIAHGVGARTAFRLKTWEYDKTDQ